MARKSRSVHSALFHNSWYRPANAHQSKLDFSQNTCFSPFSSKHKGTGICQKGITYHEHRTAGLEEPLCEERLCFASLLLLARPRPPQGVQTFTNLPPPSPPNHDALLTHGGLLEAHCSTQVFYAHSHIDSMLVDIHF